MSEGAANPEDFFRRLFSSRAAQSGAVIRRQIRDVERYVGRDAFLKDEATRLSCCRECRAIHRLLQSGTDKAGRMKKNDFYAEIVAEDAHFLQP